MKPTDLIPLYPKEAQKVFIHDKVWYVPALHAENDPFHFPGWNHETLFANSNPVIIEYCSGNGTWILNQALQNPDINWVAVEKKFTRVRKIWSKIKNHNLKNLIVICGEASLVTEKYIPTNTVKDIYINFPDPWPKKKHAKNRIFQIEFINEMARIMQKENTLTFVTDDHNYSEEVIELFKQTTQYQFVYPEPHFITDFSSYGTSFFDELWRSKGKIIRYHGFKRV